MERTGVEPVALLVGHLGVHVRRHDPVVMVVVEVGALPRRHLDFLQGAGKLELPSDCEPCATLF